MIIYKAENVFTGEIYIGKTTESLKKRISKHIYEAFGRIRNNKFHAALRNYGIKAFEFSILTKAVNKSQLKKLERKYIIHFNSIEYGYNTQIR